MYFLCITGGHRKDHKEYIGRGILGINSGKIHTIPYTFQVYIKLPFNGVISH